MAGYIGNKAVGINVTTGDILGDVGVGGDVSVGDDLAVTGNVGIGTSTPGQLLEIDAGSGNNAGITIRMGTGSSGANDSFIGFENSAGTEIFRTRYDNPTTSYVVESDLADPILTLTRAGLATLKNGLTLTDGNLTVAAGHGINFAATGNGGVSTPSELLDDYEEGTLTIGYSGATIGGGNTTAHYTKVGSIVFWSFYSEASNISSASGNATITGLPFTVRNNAAGYAPVNIAHNTFFDGSTTVGCQGYHVVNSTTMIFSTQGALTSSTYVNNNGRYLMISGTYFTDA